MLTITPEYLKTLSISQIANVVSNDWKKVSIYAEPYLDAMYSLESINDNYILDSGRSIVAYFMSNATSWKGDVARMVKTELKNRLNNK
jgi:hypothetical protein